MAKRKETVTRVIDGDTFLTATRKHPIRLAGVDTPERGTKAGTAATRKLKNMIEGRKVSVQTVARDVFGRAVANVRVGNKSVNSAMEKKR